MAVSTAPKVAYTDIHVRVPADLYDQVKALADAEERSINRTFLEAAWLGVRERVRRHQRGKGTAYDTLSDPQYGNWSVPQGPPIRDDLAGWTLNAMDPSPYGASPLAPQPMPVRQGASPADVQLERLLRDSGCRERGCRVSIRVQLHPPGHAHGAQR